MSNRFRPPRSGRRVPAEAPEDADPSLYFGTPHDRGPDRKTLQLCKQVERALTIALAGETGDEVLRDVLVDSVRPAPDASRLLVTVFPASSDRAPDRILAHLTAAKPRLRAAAASAIHRKRAPELQFCVGATAEDEP